LSKGGREVQGQIRKIWSLVDYEMVECFMVISTTTEELLKQHMYAGEILN